MLKRKILFAITGIIIFIIVYFIWSFFRSPVYSLYQTKKAILNHNYQEFDKYVNIDSVIENYVVRMPVKLPEPADTLEKLAEQLGRSAVFGLKAQMTKIVNKQLKKAIEQGKMDYLFNEKNNTNTINIIKDDKWKAWRNINFGKIDFIKREAKVAIIGIILKNNTKGKTFVLLFKMRNNGECWQIVDLVNFNEMFRLLEFTV
ncbi:MAG: hypothetical protein KA792_05055 [Bacteroidales bacterium]|nr:hypothetical protein [Bacteroidales bacterium]